MLLYWRLERRVLRVHRVIVSGTNQRQLLVKSSAEDRDRVYQEEESNTGGTSPQTKSGRPRVSKCAQDDINQENYEALETGQTIPAAISRRLFPQDNKSTISFSLLSTYILRYSCCTMPNIEFSVPSSLTIAGRRKDWRRPRQSQSSNGEQRRSSALVYCPWFHKLGCSLILLTLTAIVEWQKFGDVWANEDESIGLCGFTRRHHQVIRMHVIEKW